MNLSRQKTLGGGLYARIYPYLLLIPTFLIGGVVLIYPLVNGVLLSFTSYSLLQPTYNWAGFRNYLLIFRDPIYWEVFSNSLIIVFSAVLIQVTLGLIVALLLNNKIPGRGFFRGLIFII